MVPRALAALGASAWAATSDGVYQIEERRCARLALAGRDLVAIAAGGGTLAAASESQLFRAELTGAGAAGWLRPAAALPARARGLAVDGRGTVLVADAEGILSVGSRDEARRVLRGRVDALTACGDDAAALTPDGVYLWDGAEFRRAGARPPVRVLACGDSTARRWIGGGLGLWTSPDGSTWTPWQAGLGAPIDAVAAVGGRLWIATDLGLTPAGLDREPPAPARPPLDGIPPLSGGAHRAAPPLWCWPTVTAALTVDASSHQATGWSRRAVTAFVLLRFPLGRARAPLGDRAAWASERLRRQEEMARLQVAAQAESAAAADPVDADELAAWRDLAASEREALR